MMSIVQLAGHPLKYENLILIVKKAIIVSKMLAWAKEMLIYVLQKVVKEYGFQRTMFIKTFLRY